MKNEHLDARNDCVGIALLTAVRREVDAVLRPDLSSSYAKLSANWVCQALDYLLLAARPDAASCEARKAVLADLADTTGPVSDLLPDIGDRAGAIPLIAAKLRATGQETSSDTIHAIARLNAGLVRAEAERSAAWREAAARQLEALEVEATPERVQSYFDTTTEFSGITVRAVTRMPGGYSRDTYLVDTFRTNGTAAQFAIRRDLPFGPVETSATAEFVPLRRLHELGIPVAYPLAAVEDPAPLGQPFLVSEGLAGCTASDPMAENKAVGEAGALELARILARLHTIDPVDAGFTVAPDPRLQVHDMIAFWRRKWERHRRHDSDLVEAAFIWLEQHVPHDIARSVIVHGDYRAENAMMHEGRISGILDWEFIHAGDAAEDLEYVKLYIQPFLDPERFEAAYLEAGGVRSSRDSADFYEVFRSVRNVVCCDTAWYGFLTGAYPAMRLAFQGATARRFLMGYLAQTLEKVTRPA